MSSKYVLRIVKIIIILILLGLYFSYFFKGVINSWSQGLTNLASTDEEFGAKTTATAPTIIVYMKPEWKTSVLEKYNITESFFQMAEGSYEHLIKEKTMREIITEASFRWNHDFKFGMSDMYPNPSPRMDLKLGLNTFSMKGENYTISVSEMYSMFKGVCYAVKSDLPMSPTNAYLFSAQLTDDLAEKPDQLGLTIVADEDSLGISFQIWETNPSMKEQAIGFKSGTTQITIHEIRKTRIVGCNKASLESKHECFAKKADDFIRSSKCNCTHKCKPMVVKSYYDRYFEDTESFPDCISLEDEHCMYQQFLKIGTLYNQCQSQCITTAYSGRVAVTAQEFFNQGHGNKSAEMILYYGSNSRTLLQEYWVYDTEGMIGTLGGSLGLFLGFSFYGVISDLLDLCWKAVTKQN